MSDPTSADPAWLLKTADGIAMRVRVIPGARQTAITDIDGDGLRIRLAAPPVDGKANTELSRFLARMLSVRPSAVSIIAGQRSRSKRVVVTGDPAQLETNARALITNT